VVGGAALAGWLSIGSVAAGGVGATTVGSGSGGVTVGSGSTCKRVGGVTDTCRGIVGAAGAGGRVI
jgi:hypothetical protein